MLPGDLPCRDGLGRDSLPRPSLHGFSQALRTWSEIFSPHVSLVEKLLLIAIVPREQCGDRALEVRLAGTCTVQYRVLYLSLM